MHFFRIALILWSGFALPAPSALADSPPPADGVSVFDCLMDPARVTQVSARTAGIIDTVAVTRGQKVVAGQVVARLETSLAEAGLRILLTRAAQDSNVRAHEAQLDLARRRLERAQTLVEQNVQTTSQLEELEFNLALAASLLEQARLENANAKAEAERARIELDGFVVRAPTDGLVTGILAQPGEYTSGDHPILEITEMSPLHVSAFLPIGLYSDVQPGQIVTVYPDAPILGRYDIPIRVIDQVFDTASRTFGIEADLPNPDGALPAGHRCVLSLGAAP